MSYDFTYTRNLKSKANEQRKQNRSNLIKTDYELRIDR